MQEVKDDVAFQILEHLRALRTEVAILRERIEAMERRLPAPGPAGR